MSPAASAHSRLWHECDLRLARTNVRSWESNGLNAHVAFRPFMTQSGHRPGRNPAAQQSVEVCYPFAGKHGRGRAVHRRSFITLIGGAAAAVPIAAPAQQPAIPVIGLLDPRSPGGVAGRLRGFRQGLNEAGFVDGQNATIEYRWA